MQIGMVGLGKMGANMTTRLLQHGHQVVAYDRSPGAVKSAADGMLGSTGPISNEVAGINNSIKDIDSQRIDIQSQLAATQARYQAQFSALDTLLASMNSTSSFLTQQLSNLPNYYNKG